MEPIFVILGVIAVVEVYYWFFWLPKNWQDNRECQDIKLYIDTVWRDGSGLK